MANIPTTAKGQFFSQRNEMMLESLLTDDFKRRIGKDLSEKEKTRLTKTVEHYMKSVYEDPDNSNKPIQALNKDVLQEVVPDFMSYIRRQSTSADADPLRTNVNNRFEQLQTDRMTARAPMPAAPDFQLSLEDSNDTPAINRYEELKRMREAEARRLDEAQATLAPLNEDMVRRNQSDDDFRVGLRDASLRDMNALAIRETEKNSQRYQMRQDTPEVPPDPRFLLLGEQGVMGGRGQPIPNANPTLIVPDTFQRRGPLPQDIIKPQNDILTYRENEYNLAIYSADRDWVNNKLENRYNFSVNFDPANNSQSYGLSPSTYIKFKNIARIEMVKVILPIEGIDTISLKTSTSAYDTTKIMNILSFPYLQVRVEELNNNNYGTNDGVNNSFGLISYEAYWASDSLLKNKGFTRFVPKFMKCQKIYYPTPLSTLQKLTIRIQRPDGSLVTSSADALDVSGAVLSSMLGSPLGWMNLGASGTVNVANSFYYDSSGEYIWIQTSAWFSQYTVTQGDRIVLSNLAYPSAITSQTSFDFFNYLTRSTGHIVVDIGQGTMTGTRGVNAVMTFADGTSGSNKLGYSNYIIIRNNFTDPTTGAVSVVALNTTLTGQINPTTLSTNNPGPGFSTGRLLNLNHQVQVIFRVITRDMDSATRLRPDNM
jgi:hypothetical protein